MPAGVPIVPTKAEQVEAVLAAEVFHYTTHAKPHGLGVHVWRRADCGVWIPPGFQKFSGGQCSHCLAAGRP